MSSNGFRQSAYNEYSNSNIDPSDIDIGNDIIKTGNIFMSDPKRHEDLKMMLENNKDSAKLEAMKRIITMVAKGRMKLIKAKTNPNHPPAMDMIKAAIKSSQDRTGTDSHLCSWAPQEGRGPDPAPQSRERPAGRSSY